MDGYSFTHLRAFVVIALAFIAGGGLAVLVPTSGRAAPVLPECADLIDNDGDGLIDLLDPECRHPDDRSEAPAGPPTTTGEPPPTTTTGEPPPPTTTSEPPPTTTTEVPPTTTTEVPPGVQDEPSPSGQGVDGEGTFVSTTSTDGQPPPPTLTGSSSPPGVLPLPHLTGVAVVRLAGRMEYYGARITHLGVRAPAGAGVSVHCRHRSCGTRHRVTKRVRSGEVRIRRFERPLRTGTTLHVFVSKRGFIGKYTVFVIRRNRAPRRFDACLAPASRSPMLCTAG